MDRLHEAVMFLKAAGKKMDYINSAFDFEGAQVICDGVVCIAFNEGGRLALNMRAAKFAPKYNKTPLDEAVKKANEGHGRCKAYLSIKTLEAFIKARRAARRDEYAANPARLVHKIDSDFIERDHPIYEVVTGVYVDSVRLLRVMRLITRSKKQLVRIKAGATGHDPVGVSGVYGDALIMPVLKRY